MSAIARDAAKNLADLYLDDRREHGEVPPVGTTEYVALRDRDRGRRVDAERLLALLDEAGATSATDLYHTAWLFNHGDAPADALRAHELARRAADLGHEPARWLSAAAYDRWCMYEGRPQKYGTQFVPDGVRYRLWDVDPSTTDEERARFDVPSLETQLARARDMTRDLPQSPMDSAPEWLKAPLERWAREAD
jgi:hypothetical protein